MEAKVGLQESERHKRWLGGWSFWQSRWLILCLV